MWVAEGEIRLRRSAVEQSSLKCVLEKFYRREARERFTRRADHFAEQMGVAYERPELRNQRTRLGRLLNERNAQPELAPSDGSTGGRRPRHRSRVGHLAEQSHDDAFCREVAEHDPDYAAHAE